MITLNLIPGASPPGAKQGAPAGSTALDFQPASAGIAPTAPASPFPRTSRPSADFEAVRSGVRIPFETALVDLSVAHSLAAGTALVIPLQGTAYMIDKGADVGLATVHLQDQSSVPANTINIFPGDANNNLAFTFWMIENTAQPGKVLRIHYGTDIFFQPGLGGNIVFTGGVSISQTVAGSPQGADQASVNGFAYQTNNSCPAVAAQTSAIALQVSNGSSLKVYLDKLRLTSTVATRVQITKEAIGYCNANAAAMLKKDGTGAGGLTTFTNNNVSGTGPPFDQPLLEANKTLDIDFGGAPLVIPANSQLAVTSIGVNLLLGVTFFVRQF